MAIKFTAHRTPKPNGRKGETLTHARALCHGTYKLDEICRLISERSSVTSADVKAVLDSLSWVLDYALSGGYHVELEELGYFSPSLRSKQKENGKVSVCVDGINFRCSTKLKEKMKEIKLEHIKPRVKDNVSVDAKSRLQDYLERNKCVTPRIYAGLMNCSRYRAQADLTSFVEEGLLQKVGHHNKVLYLLA
ncbi:HU family DNA-binding protein [Parabacteroides chinchillae]|uniref:DNA-binding protein, histone-like, putative n=1 Tax=Parabacteroides chinchillae TaxID=871327 RepID=A0A8G2F5A0_9BACT|nr:HU family DNA-binding protein [Parabacteroides chinchillae]SEG18934.1 DNA-binding protein, histone-like, putative [Parabacteroides chinchillae]